MFAELELAYHNQFRKAWPSEGELRMAKKYWCSALENFTPAVILKATRQVTTTQTFLPTLSALVSACENSMTLFGLSSPRDAYREACLASEPKSAFQWSHVAVYLAGQACDWFALSTRPESEMLPLFEYHYRLLCHQALNGEELKLPEQMALPQEAEARALTDDEQKAKLAGLRKALDF